MAYKLIETSKGQFAIDWEIVTRIISSYVRARCQAQYSRSVMESQTSLNPLSWGLPDLHYVEVDWEKVNAETLKSPKIATRNGVSGSASGRLPFFSPTTLTSSFPAEDRVAIAGLL